jgi:hypothetical protein
MKKFAKRAITGSWVPIETPPEFKGISSHTVTSVPPAKKVEIVTGNNRTFPVHAQLSKDPVTSIFVVGGEDGPRTALESVWRMTDGKFRACAVENPMTLLGHQAESLHGLLHVFGGRSGGTSGEGVEFNDIFVLRQVPEATETFRFEKVPVEGERPCARSYHAMTVCGDALYVFGGCAGHDRLNDLWRYDSLTGKWERLHDGSGGDAAAPSKRGGPGLFVPTENDVFVVCGFNGKEMDDVWHYAVDKKEWTRLEGGPGARSVFASVNMNNRFVVYGGERDPAAQGHLGAGHFLGDVWLFDPYDRSWQEVKCEGRQVPEPRGWTEMCRLTNDSVLLTGGLNEKNERLRDAFKLRLHF